MERGKGGDFDMRFVGFCGQAAVDFWVQCVIISCCCVVVALPCPGLLSAAAAAANVVVVAVA